MLELDGASAVSFPPSAACPDLRRGIGEASVHQTMEKKASEDAVMKGKMVSGREQRGERVAGVCHARFRPRPAACTAVLEHGRCCGLLALLAMLESEWNEGEVVARCGEKRGGAGWFL